ncbi:hypothetical protein BKA82DRAFT_14143 [Pisolithus tinctorius]|uniref:Snurportin-1 n=1 Tax=Pisolithus tinctorius Marx 270 TaxID=870435 RepID=A0A0C3JKG7_PISTI|nr:hypothetical protein BKA82DRAFT_14143 [Pisolithus tinctorius]KIO09633.1 hypothetical protein M404DRAFT_14143 [Pisolithus tinctorius Marx 270]
MLAHADRKASYKVPPTVVTDRLVSQEARRIKALEEQKRRRAQKFDTARNLDAFADLSLGLSDDEGDVDADDESVIIREGIAGYASLAKQPATLEPPQEQEQQMEDITQPKKKRNKNKRKRTKAKPSKWADKCMYAELLEMKEDPNVWGDGKSEPDDGLPSDMEQGWVAVAPVPIGKRCLAVTHQSAAGVIGISPNTTLRSRLLGKMLLPRFPSSLPPLTILDCILDTNWEKNGIVHVLDVIKWKGQDVADCETPFRLWWRDTRLAELPKFSPPSSVFHFSLANDQAQAQPAQQPDSYRFPYPTSFIPIPYHSDTTWRTLFSSIIPLARSTREISVEIPTSAPFQPSSPAAMSIDTAYNPIELRSSKTVTSQIPSDGLLLYVAQASYEEGTSPLSCWVPIQPITGSRNQEEAPTTPNASPLDLFQRLVYRRLSKRTVDGMINDGMEM